MSPTTRKGIASGLVLVALALLVVGGLRVHKVYDRSSGTHGLLTFSNLSELDLIVDATFGGVVRRDRLYSTYDRKQARGKRSCPT